MKDLVEIGKDGYAVFTDIALMLAPYKALHKRDSSTRKQLAVKELSYVAMFSDYRSPYSKLDEADRMHSLIRDLDMPKDWRPDKAIFNAMEFYQERNSSPEIDALESQINFFQITRDAMSTVQKSLGENLAKLKSLSEIDLDAFESEPDEDKAAAIAKLIAKVDAISEKVIKQVSSIVDLSSKMEKALDTLERLKERVEKSSKGNARIKGGGEVGIFEE